MSHEHIDVKYVAKLARLDLSEEEVKTFQVQLDAILQHVESLASIDLPENLNLDDHELLSPMREDSTHASLTQELVLLNAPDQAQSQIRVPKVVADA
jgi:aspartyl-tRNA(Asn)/glutamyl-tRNA(Gln) amidotransferase subunit C